MKKSIYKSIFILITALCIFSTSLKAQEVAKEFHREFGAALGTTLDLNNRYGNITIQSWDQDKITIDVKVTIEMQDEVRAQKLLEYIDIQFTEGQSLVSAKTMIDEKFNFSGWGSRSKRFSIVYKVKMPAYANLTLANRYGDTDIDALDGRVDLDIKYGNLTAGKLTRGNEKPMSAVKIAYGKATIGETGWLDIYTRYSPVVRVEKGQALLLDSKYSKIQIVEASSLVGNSKYDNVRIENINNLILETGYDDINIGVLRKKLDFNGSYGSLTAENVPAGFESIKIITRYTGVKLGIDESASYKLDAKVTYGGLKIDEENFKYQKRIIENNSNETSGVVGKDENPSSVVSVQSSYGSVRLY